MRKKYIFILSLVLFISHTMGQNTTIRIATKDIDLVLKKGTNGRLYQAYFGEKLLSVSDLDQLDTKLGSGSTDGSAGVRGWEVYPGSGMEDYFQPAFAVQHVDGNMATLFKLVDFSQNKIDDNVSEFVLNLADSIYPVKVKLFYRAYYRENTIKTWTEIQHGEAKPVRISEYASNMLYFNHMKYFLTEFSGDWAREVNMSTQQLQYGKKVLDTKLGSRAAMHTSPFFELGLDQPVSESEGNVLLGTIGWTGNFRFTFEVDNTGNLRVLSGINPYASDYLLSPNEKFTTPEFIFTYSTKGVGPASRNFHRWARNYQLKDGKKERTILLNNWETTRFKFDEAKLKNLMQETKELGADLFLLDDGWFGNKYPRNNDNAGLGDWDVNKNKLPNGIPGLVKSANEAGVKFGIWIEPEMVNPKSELMEKHPEWVIKQPNRKTYLYRNQLVLDLSNPKVQDYVFSIVDNILKENPSLAYFKWDCNSPITNVYSPYLKDRQENLYVDHVRGVYNVFKRVREKYPHIEMMLCSGGGARCDYEALKYFQEFWASDNTDPVERIYIQWGFSQFFPAKAIAAHVTSWNKQASIKFRTEVAMMEKLGFDISLEELSKEDREFCKVAVQNYKELMPTILDGDLFRLISPYESNHSASMYVDADKKNAVLFAYDIHPRFGEKTVNVQLEGLDPLKKYKITKLTYKESGSEPKSTVYSGDYLMKIGLPVFTTTQLNSQVFKIQVQ